MPDSNARKKRWCRLHCDACYLAEAFLEWGVADTSPLSDRLRFGRFFAGNSGPATLAGLAARR
jgi:hypothetical protein